MAQTPTTDTPTTTTPGSASTTGADVAANAKASIDKGIATAREQAGPLAEKAKSFAKSRPWATAALVGTVAAAVLGSLRRGRL